MAFTIKDAKIININNLLLGTDKAYQYKYSFLCYKKAKLIMMGIPTIQEEPPEVPQHYVSGHVVETTIPINRKVNLHRSDTGELVGATTSSGIGGYFYGETIYSGAHYVVCLDDDAGVDYNDLIYGNIYPATISG